jgi:ankyrin repeat protein
MRLLTTAASSMSIVALCAVLLSAQGNDAQRSLIQAIQRGDTPAVSRLLASGAHPNTKDDEGVPALMLATLFADVACVEQLLKRGADPNQADSLGATPLMWAIPDIQKARALIEHGASVNARSTNLGRTPLLIAAASPGSVDLLNLLLARGADLRAKDTAGSSALAVAMLSSDVEVLRFLVGRGLDPKEEVPIASLRAVYSRARPAVIEFAMARGVSIPKEMLNRSNWQSPALLQRWIERGADINARIGNYGVTPLLTATSSEFAGADTLRLLLEHGADPNVQDTEGEKPLDWATYRADQAKIAVLEKYGATRGQGPRRTMVAPPGSGGITNARISVDRSVSLLLKSSPEIFAGRRCFTCHNNTLPAEAAALARRKGIAIGEDLAEKNAQDILAVFRRAADPVMQSQPTNIPGGMALTVGYGLMALAAEGQSANKATAAMTHWMLATQMTDGSWLGNGVNRPPMESSTLSHTTIAVRGLMLYPTPGDKSRIDQALARARNWLLSADTPTAEDRAMRLMGLVWTKASRSAITAAIQEIVRRQTPTGGWSQLAQLDPDAYATGQSLIALHEAGIAVTDDVYQKGVKFLLNTQYPDGAWLVRTRAFPVQPYFESGFPFGRHQWISAAGTAWAARAIALTLPDTNRSALRQ